METKSCSRCYLEVDARARKCAHCHSRQPGGLLHRDVEGRLVAGVCAAVAEELGVERLLVRAGFLVALLLTGGLAFWAYVALWVLTPAQRGGTPPLERWVKAVRGFFSSSRQEPTGRTDALERLAPREEQPSV